MQFYCKMNIVQVDSGCKSNRTDAGGAEGTCSSMTSGAQSFILTHEGQNSTACFRHRTCNATTDPSCKIPGGCPWGDSLSGVPLHKGLWQSRSKGSSKGALTPHCDGQCTAHAARRDPKTGLLIMTPNRALEHPEYNKGAPKYAAYHYGTCQGDTFWHVKEVKMKAQKKSPNGSPDSHGGVYQFGISTQLWDEGYTTNIVPVKMSDYLKPGNKTLIITSAADGANGMSRPHRCGIRKALHVSAWYKPPPEQECYQG